jgi:glutamate---cysteine ligase / carboxylate-amine ligase
MSGITDQFTLGVEEEYQIVHPETRELHSYISRLLEDGKSVLRERMRAEMHQSVVEVGTSVCPDVAAVRRELVEMRGELSRLAEKGGLKIVAASTHPTSDWKAQQITDHDRYHEIVADLQDVARQNLIFGLHVHVGIKDKDVAVELANQIRYFLPHILALTTSSPFWLGRLTGLSSTRCEIFKRFPRTGIPDRFASYKHFTSFVELLVKTGCIDNGKRIWWDVRVHHLFDTVEVRICDMPTNMDHTIAVVALIQALMAKLYLLHKGNMGWRDYPRSLIEENKWRAMRYGIHGRLIDFGEKRERPFDELCGELLDFTKDTVSMFGTEKEIATIPRILKDGTSADRQRQVYEKSGNDAKAVVDWLIAETMRGI